MGNVPLKFKNIPHTNLNSFRTCGSISLASAGEMPQNPASNLSASSRTWPASTYEGWSYTSAGTPFAISSSFVKRRRESCPRCRLRQKAAMSGAPGNRPARPTTASRADWPQRKHRFGPLSALRTHPKAPYKTYLLWETLRALNRPGRARTVGSPAPRFGDVDARRGDPPRRGDVGAARVSARAATVGRS